MDAASQLLPDVPLTERRPAPATPASAGAPTPAGAAAPAMDREFIERNQIVERYLAGRLPPRGAVEFEHFCAAHPELLDAIGLPARVHAGLRLLDAGGKPSPWEQKKRPVWEKPPVLIGFAALVVILLGAAAALALQVGDRGAKIAALEKRIIDQPLAPATATRTIKLVPARGGPTHRPAVTVGGGPVQFADLKIDLAWSKYSNFRITIDREDQGRVAVLHNVEKDSNGHVRIAFNTSALGPGNYDFTIQGLTWRGEPVAQAWATIGIQR